MGKQWKQCQTLFLGAPKSLQMVTAAMKLKDTWSLEEKVWCRIQKAWGWCTRMTQRDGMGREVGGGFRMGNTCTPMVDACWFMAKPIQYCKVKKRKKKSYNQPRQHIEKQRHYFAIRSPSMVFPVVMYGCESWTIKKAECRRIATFELWCWRRLLRVP